MKYREDERHQLDMRAKAIIFASIIVSFLVALVPVWQKGMTRTNHYELILAEEKLEKMEEEEKSLIAFISSNGDNGRTEIPDLVAGV